MANELTLRLQASILSGNLQSEFPQQIIRPNVAAQEQNGGVFSLTTSETDLTLTGITTPGWLILKNLDTTNFLTWGPKSGGSMILCGKILAGEFAIFRLGAAVTMRMKADTATVKVQWWVVGT
jgi:hypothetical protein